MRNVSTKKSGRRFPLILISLLASGALIRIINLGNIIFYWDEPLHSVRIAFQPLSYVAAWNNGSAFFSLLVHFLLPLGKMEVMARIVSVIFGSLAIIAVYFLGKVLVSKKAGLIAAVFMVFSPYLIQYSQQSRMYASYCFFSILTAYFFYRAITEGKTKFFALFSLSAVLNVYNHIFGLFVMPVFALFSAMIWLRKGIQNKGKIKKPFHPAILFKFAGWTFLALFIVAVFYIPDKNIQSYLSVSVDRAAGIMSQGAATFGMIRDILQTQLRTTATGFFWAFLSLAVIGFLVKLKDRFMECIFSLLYILIPFVIFILIKPNDPTALSADRYFLFFLPVLFIYMAQGILTIIKGLLFPFRRLKSSLFQKQILQNVVTFLTVFLLFGTGFDLKTYYIDYWRLGALKIDTEVRKYLENNLRKDSFVFIDEFPATSMVTAINPMTRNLKRSEMERTIRKKLIVTAEKNPVMFFTMHPNLLKFFARGKIDLCVITQARPKKKKALFKAIEKIPYTTLHFLKKNWLIAFQDNKVPLQQKWLQAVEILSHLNKNRAKAKDYHYLASKNHLFARNFKGFQEEFTRAQNIILFPEEANREGRSFILRGLDRLFNLKPIDLLEIHYKRFEESISHLLLFQGDVLRKQERYPTALKAYRTCTELSMTYHEQVSIRLGFLANKIFRKGQAEESIPYYKEAIRLNPQRYDLMFMLAEAFSRTGKQNEAKKTYQKVFGLEALPPPTWKKLLQTNPLVLIWKKDNIFFVLFRSQKGGTLRGEISSGRKIKNVEKHMFVKSDHADLEKTRLFLYLTTNKGTIKLISFQSAGKSRVTFDLLVNNGKKNRNIVVVKTGQNPTRIPFTWRF